MTKISDRAASFCVLLLDPDRQWLNIMRRELLAAGIREVLISADPKKALVKIRDTNASLIITHNDIKFVSFLRHHDASPNRQIPIIMLISNVHQTDVALMRDAGVNEIVAKPCSVDQLVKRIEAIALHPREFVDSEKFTGPNRRRREGHLNGPDRRSE